MFFFCTFIIFFFKQKTAYEMRISDWSSDVCSSDLLATRQNIVDWGAEDGQDQPAVGIGIEVDVEVMGIPADAATAQHVPPPGVRQIGRASCRERVCQYV